MKNLNWLSLICLSLIFTTSCIDRGNNGLFNCVEGEGDVVTKELLLNDFRGIKSRGPSKVFVTQGSPLSVTVEGQENIIENIETDIQDGIWEIEFEDCVRDYYKLRIHITMPEIERLEVSGSGDIIGQNDFDVDNLDLKVKGSGSIDVAVLDATKLDVEISGSGDILLAGFSNAIDSKTSGSGDVKAFLLETNIAYAKITGSGDTQLWVKDDLEVKITGSGDVYYKGNPFIDTDIKGSGRVINSN